MKKMSIIDFIKDPKLINQTLSTEIGTMPNAMVPISVATVMAALASESGVDKSSRS